MSEPTERVIRVRGIAVVLVGGLLFVLAIAGGCVWLWAGYAYRYAVSAQMPILARAILVYRDEWGILPPGIEELKASGYGGAEACALPRTRWEALTVRRSGPAPLYCPVRDWDGNTPYVVGVLGIPCGSPAMRSYVMAGQTRGLWATEEELFKRLDTDDALREKNGEKALWRNSSVGPGMRAARR